jgi:hypothetical protein
MKGALLGLTAGQRSMIENIPMASASIELRSAFVSVVNVVQCARSATSGWRTICVRERRRLGGAVGDSLAALDLDDDVAKLSPMVCEHACAAHDFDAVLFNLFEASDDGVPYAAFHVAGVASRGRAIDDVLRDPWTPDRRFLSSRALDAILATAAHVPAPVRPLVDYALLFGATALLSRFASAQISHRVFVAFDEDHPRPPPEGVAHAVEIVAVRRETSKTSLEAAIPRLLQA